MKKWSREVDALSTSSKKFESNVKLLQKGDVSLELIPMEKILSLFPFIQESINSTLFMINILKTVTIDLKDEGVFKQVLTSITTCRDSLLLLVDLCQFHSTIKGDIHLKKFFNYVTIFESTMKYVNWIKNWKIN